MKQILLGGRKHKGYIALVDNEDYEYLNQWNWSYSLGYARSKINGKLTMMHKLLLNTLPFEQIDHINRNKLDNRKSNLRACTASQNSINISMNKNNTSGYRGVTYNKISKKWIAMLGFKRIGTFINLDEAIKARDKKAKEIYGEFAILNFPE